MNQRKSKRVSKKKGQNVESTSVEIRSGKGAAFPASHLLALLVLALVVFAVYVHSGGFGFLYDDHKLILRQGRADSLQDFTRVFTERHWDNLPYYRPVSRLTMVVQKWLHGDNAGPFHLFNTLLMSICAIVASRLLAQQPFRIPFALTIVGAGIFALHPAASCVVYPICSGRETLIPAVLIIGAVGLWIRGTRMAHLAAIFLLPVALLSKEQSIITPVLFFMADFFRISQDAPPRDFSKLMNWCVRYAPIVLILAAYVVVRRILFAGSGEHAFGLIEHPELPPLSILFALQTTFLPFVDLRYEPPAVVWLVPWRACLAVAATAFLCWIATKTLRGQKSAVSLQRSEETSHAGQPSLFEVVLFWLSWIFLALAPTANILKQEANFADRYVFLSILGVIGIIGTMLGTIWNDKKLQKPILVTAGVIALVCGAISFHRGSFYQDDPAFLNQWIKSNPRAAQAHVALAEHYVTVNEVEKAWPHLEKTLEIQPASPVANNIIGHLLNQRGKPTEALPYLQASVKAAPGYAEALNNYAIALSMLGQYVEAIKNYEAAIKINPNYVEPYVNLGLMYDEMGRYDLAKEWYYRAIEINSSYAQSHFGLGNVAMTQNELIDAEKHFRDAIQLAPNFVGAYINLGIIRYQQNSLAEAERLFRQALELDPNNRLAQQKLKLILEQK